MQVYKNLRKALKDARNQGKHVRKMELPHSYKIMAGNKDSFGQLLKDPSTGKAYVKRTIAVMRAFYQVV
ncbi:MAG: hypothetical protein IMZ52_02400 [Actinobacteria bacterium]|nr:hypothetical protein [Actinomycetota bacterium]MBE3114874.1 hypothetical protein [Actinomycetota bacterium]